MSDPAGAFAGLSIAGQLAAAGAAGLITGLTPCAYLLLPLTICVLGAESARSFTSSVRGAACYLLGAAASLFALGLLIILAGPELSSLFADRLAGIAAAAIFLLLALLTLELLKFSALGRLAEYAESKTTSSLGAFSVGAVCGLITSPGIVPIMQLALGALSRIPELRHQALLLLTFCGALLLPLLPFALLAGVIKRTTRSAGWLNAVKFVTAVCMLIFALASLWPHVESLHGRTLSLPIDMVALCSALAGVLAWLSYRFRFTPVRLIAALALAFTLSPLLSSARPPAELKWNSSLEAAQTDALARHTTVMLVFYADWCEQCRRLEQELFNDRLVSLKLQEFALARADLSDAASQAALLKERFQLSDLPAILFLSPDGSEIPQSRITASLPPADFLRQLSSVKR